MPTGDIETYFEGTEWHSRVTGEDKPFHTADTKEKAEAAGRAEAMELKVEHVTKNQDGSIAERNTYGHDPQNLEG